ncbi:MAG: HD domain-containing protein [Bacteroidales bacterium]|nr:HD domain-containing protein [Bacteroidales bacterium]
MLCIINNRKLIHNFVATNNAVLKSRTNKRKIINDPVYGFIDIPGDFIHDIIENLWFQRLRHIRQLGLTNYVYPGANHSRLQHSLGALHLLSMAVLTLRLKGVAISNEEEEAASAAILLHDAGHGPFSHALEYSLLSDVTHEEVSEMIMKLLNESFRGRLDGAIEIFRGEHQRKFLHELIAGQTDMDRLDYLRRDSFFTGVIEGSVSSDRIIKMLDVRNDRLVIEEKGIYSVEKFLIARRLMYWQVYMHKTVIAAENVLSSVMRRARELAVSGDKLSAPPWLKYFLTHRVTSADITGTGMLDRDEIASHFSRLDDNDILQGAKIWMDHKDPILSSLCRSLILRDLPAVELSNTPFDPDRVAHLKKMAGNLLKMEPDMTDYFVFTGEVSNRTYIPDHGQIGILGKNGEISDISEVSEMFNHSLLSQNTIKYFLCYPKKLRL